ncbi:MAG: glycosyltransferase family 4 protein, partial [Methylococcus sp.]
MKVIVNALPLARPLSGVGQYIYQLYQAMAGSHISCKYFYGYAWSNDLSVRHNSLFSQLDEWSEKSWLVQKCIGISRRAIFTYGSIGSHASLYHEPNFLPLFVNGPLVITLHDLSPLRLPQTHTASKVRIFAERLPAAIQRASALLVVSDFVKNEVIEYFPEAAGKITITHLGVRNQFRPQSEETMVPILRRHALVADHYLLAIGTLEPRKNLISALKAYSLLSDNLRDRYPLVIGGMRGWLTDDLDRAIDPMIRKGQVRLLGFVPDSDLNALYSGARAFIYPSLYEGFGLPPLEAMASGTPVITSNRASLPEVVGDAGIQVEPMDIDQLSQAMLSLLEDDHLHHVLRQRGLERAAQF